MKSKLQNKTAFSLIELSIVILIVGIVVAGVTQSSRLINAFKLNTARNITQSSPVASIKDLVLWLEPTAERSFADGNSNYSLEDGDAVQTWFDSNPQVTSKKDFGAPASNKRPVYVLSGINGLPSIQFSNSVAKYFENTTGVLSLLDNTYTYILVAKMTVTPSPSVAYQAYCQGASSFAGGYLTSILYYGATASLGLATGGGPPWDYYPVAIVANRVNITLATANATAIKVYNNSLTANSGTVSGTNAGSGPNGLLARVGNSPYNETEMFTGLISEVIVYDRVLKTEEINAIMTYLAKKYGVTLS